MHAGGHAGQPIPNDAAIERWLQPLPGGISLSCRAAGPRGRPVMMFLHGFPEAAFVWDDLMLHFAQRGWRCVAPNLRGYEQSSAPEDVGAYRARHITADIAQLIALEGGKLDVLVAHDWGGAIAWSLANQAAHLMRRLVIINSPHPGTFLRDLRANPAQQAASAYMNELIQPDAEHRLAADDFASLWRLFERFGSNSGKQDHPWLSAELRAQYRAVWRTSLRGGCNYYRASPLRPPTASDPGAAGVELPDSMLRIEMPTLVIWGMDDHALLPCLVDGLQAWVPQLELHRIPGATHWIVHEQPQTVAALIGSFALLSTPPARQADAS